MHFVNRVRAIWSWLPSFRAVAEAEHLPTAAQELGIVPSSLSRTVKQIEDELGVPLFDRTSKSLVLNEAGRTLLTAVREAMRIVDDALGAAVGDDLIGNVGAVATGDLVQAILIPAGAALAGSHPSLTLSAMAARSEEVSDILLRGDADAAVSMEPIGAHADLRAGELASWSRAVYVRAGAAEGTERRCVVVGSRSEPIEDGWPADLERQICAWAPDERSALELCARGDLATVAYDAIVSSCGFEGRLTRLAHPAIPSRTVFLTQRRSVGRHRRTEALVEAIRASMLSKA